MSLKGSLRCMLLLLAAIAFIATPILALGVAPAWKEFAYEQGSMIKQTVRVLNTNQETLKLKIEAQGELEGQIKFDKTLILMTADEPEASFTYTVTLPQGLDRPGLHTTNIIVTQIPEQDLLSDKTNAIKTVQAASAVISKLLVRVPYPSKYLEAEIQATGDQPTLKLFTIPIYNFGSVDLREITATVEIMDRTGKVLKEIKTDTASLAAKEQGKLTGVWATDAAPGIYHAKATVRYDGLETVVEKDFSLGTPEVKVVKVSAAPFRIGEIGRISILAQSDWSQPLNGVYADINILREGKQVTTIKTLSMDIPSLGATVLEAYWNTNGLPAGTYDLVITLKYESKQSTSIHKVNLDADGLHFENEGTGKVSAVESASSSANTWMFMLLLIAILAIVVAVLYLKLKSIEKRGNKP